MNSVGSAYVALLVVIGLPIIIASARRRRRTQDDVHRIRHLLEQRESDSPSQTPKQAVDAALARLNESAGR